MNNTAKQLVEQLGNSTEITIMSDIVHGLNFEYEQLQQENKELKFNLDTITKSWKLNVKKVKELNNILTEFEKWLEEQKENDLNENFIVVRLVDIKNKIQELKGIVSGKI